MKQKNLLKLVLFGLITILTTVHIFGQSPGDLLITEFMADPLNVGDSSGEYFEIYNTTGSPIDINGWIISDDGSNTRHTWRPKLCRVRNRNFPSFCQQKRHYCRFYPRSR